MMKYIYKKILSILPVGLFIAVLSFSSCEELKFGNDFLDQNRSKSVSIWILYSLKNIMPCRC